VRKGERIGYYLRRMLAEFKMLVPDVMPGDTEVK
jgi:hypothetical protein